VINRKKRTLQQGLSIIELMVGIAMGLFITAGAIKLFIDNLGSNRQILLEARLNQELRTAADIVARDLRRASYWDSAATGLWTAGAASVSATNPYTTINTATAGTVVYTYQRPNVDPLTNANLGFRRTEANGLGTLEVRDGTGGWQAITDPKSVNVTNFDLVSTPRIVELWEYCSCRTRLPVSSACENATLSAAITRPQIIIRQYDFVIKGKANTGQTALNDAIQREIRGTVRVRNDELKNPNGCPAA
jgi:type IV pilus assembly protein PilW